MLGKINTWPVLIAIATSLLIGFTLSTLAYRYRYMRVPGQGIVARMNYELHLTPAQREQIVGIMQDTRLDMMRLKNRFQHARRKILIDAYGQIRATLTPEQQKQFDREFALPGMRAAAGLPQSPATSAAAPTPADR